MKRGLVALLIGSLCISLLPLAAAAQTAANVAARQAELQQQLDSLEHQIAAAQGTLDTLHGQSSSLERDVDILDGQINKAKLQVQATQIAIQQLSDNIDTHTQTILSLGDKLDQEQASLGQILRNTQMVDDSSIAEVALSANDISTFFKDLDSFASIRKALNVSFTEVTNTRTQTEAERTALETRHASQLQLQQIQELEQAQIEGQEKQKQKILAETKGQEAAYQKLVQSQEQTAAQIRTELFALAGGGGQIPLPTAITLAKQASAATGVRPALILGILKQETNLGANVGQCLLTNIPSKGDGKGKKTGSRILGVMKPNRDVDPFMTLTSALGLDPFSMAVSCPPSYGYGGAMGPGQFIPSTWALYQKRIAKLAGHSGRVANPWDNGDAFLAIALLMADNGAGAQTPSAERIATLKYFAGGNWNNPAYAFYGDGVTGFAADFQQEIDILNGS